MKDPKEPQETQVYILDFRWSIRANGSWDREWFMDHERVLKELNARCKDYIVQIEETPRDGPVPNTHYQGWIKLEDKKRPTSLAIKWNEWAPGVRLVPASTEGCEALKTYAMKTETRIAGPWGKRKIPTYWDVPTVEQFYPWQKMMYDKCMLRPEARKIYWLWEPQGNMGKGGFAKRMSLQHGAGFATAAKAGDTLYYVSENQNKDVYIFNKTRVTGKSTDPTELYQALESIKDGHFMNSKYKSTMVIMDPPHVVVMANEPPNMTALSADRWIVRQIQADKTMATI